MRFLIIIPAHNEAEHISLCLYSLEYQTHQDFKIVVVNDGSTDSTADGIENFLATSPIKPKVEILNLSPSEHQPGAKVVRAFYSGLKASSLQDIDIICKFDADIIFPANYLEALNLIYQKNPKLGMASGLVRIKKGEEASTDRYNFSNKAQVWAFEDLSSPEHIRGPIKSYRKRCFNDMGGLRDCLGWDNIDVLLAKKSGWQCLTIKNLWVKHLRPTAYQYRHQKVEKMGEYFYNLGLSLPLAAVSALKSVLKSRTPMDFFRILRSFCKQKHPLLLSREEVDFIRKERWRTTLSKLKFR